MVTVRQRVRVDSEGEGELTNAEAVDLHKKRVRLMKRIKLFRKLELIYVPGACLCMVEENARVRELVDVEDETLWLPSKFDTEARTVSCREGLASIEESLHEAQCLNALESICSSQQTIHTFLAFRDRNLRGQVQITQAALPFSAN